MKTLIVSLIAVIAFDFEKPSPIPSKITELNSKSWYAEQAQQWKSFINEHSSDEEAWLHYFVSSSYAGNNSDIIQSQIEEQFPESFVSHYTKFRSIGWTDAGINELKLALAKDDSKAITLEDQLIFAEVNNSDRNSASKRVFDAGLIHSSTLNYSYNLLMSVAEDGLLIVDGLHLTVPIWVLQDVMAVRQDVSILNLELASNQKMYTDRILRQKGMNANIEELLQQEQGDKIYYALTLPRDLINQKNKDLYVVGLASSEQSGDFNHFETLRSNIEQRFLLDYLSVDFNGEPKTATGKVLSTNYIVPLLLLKEFYDDQQNTVRSDELSSLIQRLAKDSQVETRVALLLSKKETPRSFKTIEFDVKTLEKHLKQVRGNIYASEFELDNRSFWAYMEYLRKNGYDELFEQGLSDLSAYDDVTKAWLSNYLYSPENVVALEAKRRGGDYLDYPVINITHETAKAYCEWLTVQYNAQAKRKFQKVVFRLPTKKEWTMSALGFKGFSSWELNENTVKAKPKEGKGDLDPYSLSEHKILYPWGLGAWNLRTSIFNKHDCYLANVKTSQEITCPAGIKGDGWSLSAPAGSYFANGLGLYDVIGNVAEMTSEPGIAMGGSWNHDPENSTIISENEYKGRDIHTGFRLFMEVIEE